MDPSRKEMDQMCDAVIPQSVKQKYNRQPKKNKIKSPSKTIQSKPLSLNSIVKVPEKDKSSGSRTVTIEYFDKTKNKIVNKTQDLSPPRKASAIEYFDKKESKVLTKSQSSSGKPSALPFTSLSVSKSSRVPSKSAKVSSSKNKPGHSIPKKSKSTIKNTSTKTPKKSSGGFIVINDPERRRKLRSFWMRAG